MATTDGSRARIQHDILVIVLDDVGLDKLDFFDPQPGAPPYARTPRLRALSEGGIRFTNAYASPYCSPTRACIQTGRYPFRTGMGGNAELYPLPDSELLLARLLKDGLPSQPSYACGVFGKWHLTPSTASNLDWASHAVRNGYNRFSGCLSNTMDHFTWTKVEHNHGWPNPITVEISDRWSADVVRLDAASWIKERPLTRPVFAYVAFNPPHNRFQVPAFETQDGRPLLSPATLVELGNAQPQEEPKNTFQRELFYRAMLEAVDAEIGYLLDDLGRRLENTMVFVVGDNGTPKGVINAPHSATHGKGTLYQHGIHVPLIVSGPLVPRQVPVGGHVCTGLVDSVDLWSTIAEIAGARLPAPPEIDGISFLPLIREPASAGSRPWCFAQLFAPAGPYASVVEDLTDHARSLTNGVYKYIRTVTNHVLGDPDIQYTHELYRVSDDPEETHDFFVKGLTPEASAAYQYLSEQMDELSER